MNIASGVADYSINECAQTRYNPVRANPSTIASSLICAWLPEADLIGKLSLKSNIPITRICLHGATKAQLFAASLTQWAISLSVQKRSDEVQTSTHKTATPTRVKTAIRVKCSAACMLSVRKANQSNLFPALCKFLCPVGEASPGPFMHFGLLKFKKSSKLPGSR